MSERTQIDLREGARVTTDWKFLACFAAIVASVVAGYLGIHNDLTRLGADIQNSYNRSWHIADEVEASHQTLVGNGHRPDPSEVLRVTRGTQSDSQH